jgi:hypothetical protein
MRLTRVVSKRGVRVGINSVGFYVWKIHDFRSIGDQEFRSPRPSNVLKYLVREGRFGLIFIHFCLTVLHNFSERHSLVCGLNYY